MYVVVPMKRHVSATRLRDVRVTANTQLRDKLPARLAHYRKDAAYSQT